MERRAFAEIVCEHMYEGGYVLRTHLEGMRCAHEGVHEHVFAAGGNEESP